MLLPDKVNVADPAFVTIADDAPSLMIPVIDEVSELVILKVPCTLIAAAESAPVVIVMLPMAVVPPTAPVNVTSPDPAAIVKVLASELLTTSPLKVSDDSRSSVKSTVVELEPLLLSIVIISP